MTEDWDAATYDRIADPQTRWGLAVLDRLPLGGSERVLDAGCGTGRVTEHLLRRLPHGLVVALDGSVAMLAEARRRLAPWRQVQLLHADLASPLVEAVGQPVDAVLSTATFHWVTDHDALFANLAAVLRPGGALVAQCGGKGNVASALRAAAALGHPLEGHYFATAEETVARLEASGFRDIWAWLHPESAPMDRPQLEAFLATVVLRTQLDAMAPAERSEFVRAVAAAVPASGLDYVRLNILARRA
ncbi:MAG: class I SAM-dependent methyltransferase [Acidimicrobiales bacterium]